jgi:hypothetical protein
MFINYCLEIKTNVSRRPLGEVIEEFAFTKIFQIKEEFSRPHIVNVSPGGGNGNKYKVEVCNIVDINSVTVEKVINYLIEIVSINLEIISLYLEAVNKNPTLEEDSKIYIQVLYSQKKYKVEAYLAHHLIRAGLSFEFKKFIDQYFLIKKALPGEYFWNLIFLTQFGFNFYYYYWLTNDRTFKLTDEDSFNSKAKIFVDTSSQYFLREFYVDQNVMTYNHLKELYCSGKFKEVAKALGSTIRIEVKPSRKNKVTTLRIADNYEVFSMDDKYYHIRGDDFRMRKYLKNNFNVIKKVV